MQKQINNCKNNILEKFNEDLKDQGAAYYISGKTEDYNHKDIFSSNGLTNLNVTKKDKYKTGKDLLRKYIHKEVYNELQKNELVEQLNTDEIYLNNGRIEWKIKIKLNTKKCSNLNSVREAVKTLSGASNVKDCLKDNSVYFGIIAGPFDIDKKTDGYSKQGYITTSISEDLDSIIKAYYENEDSEANLIGTNQDMFDFTKYKEPKCMKFVPYLTNEDGSSKKLEADLVAFNMSNTFTELYLKSSDGYAPQFIGSSDIIVEAKFVLTEQDVIHDLNNLTATISQLTKTYRRVMPCYPLKVKNSYMQTLGLNEMLLDTIQINTIEGFPGVYEITLRMTSVDRSLRQREALKKLDVKNYTAPISESSIIDMFAIQEELAKAELYPDLDLPTVDDLSEHGWKFLKYTNTNRLFVDPDFYIIYSFKYTAQIIKELLYNYIYKMYLGDDGLEKLTNNPYVLEDSMAIKMNARFDKTLGVTFENANDFAELYDKILEDVSEQAESETLKKVIGTNKYQEYEDVIEIGSSIEYLVATGVSNGWEIRPN